MNARMRLLSVGTFACVLAAGVAAMAQPAPVAPPAPPGPPAAAPAPAAPPAAAALPPAAAPAAAQPPVAVQPSAEPAPAAPLAAAPLPPPMELAPPRPLPPPLLEPQPIELPAAPAEPPIASKLTAGKDGFVQLGLLMQGWFYYDHAKDLLADKSGKMKDDAASFRLRRTQFKVKGSIIPEKVDYLVLIDPLKVLKFGKGDTVTSADGASVTQYKPPGDSPSSVDSGALLDFSITFKTCVTDISVGQWKLPIAREGSMSSSDLLMPERALASRYFGDSYDMGIKLEKKLKITDSQTLLYSVQLLNGGALNQVDNNLQKDVALRLEYSPIEGFMVGGAGLMSVGQRSTQTTTRDMAEADIRFEHSGLLVDVEALWSRGHGGPLGTAQWRRSRGGFAGLGYTIDKKLQPVVRVGLIDVDERVDEDDMPLWSRLGFKDDQARAYEVGLNYFLKGKEVKFQASYSYFNFDEAKTRQQAIVSTQLSF